MDIALADELSAASIERAAATRCDTLAINIGCPDADELAEWEERLSAHRDALQRAQLGIASITMAGNPLEGLADEVIDRYRAVIDLAHRWNCGVLATLGGYCDRLSFDENVARFEERFARIVQHASERGVRVALNPWPGAVREDGALTRRNLATSPALYERLFASVPDQTLGIEYDPAQYAWQGIDLLDTIERFSRRIHHCRFTDVIIDDDAMRTSGIYDPSWHRPAPLGLGALPWERILTALHQVGYDGYIAIAPDPIQGYNLGKDETLLIALKLLLPLSERLRQRRNGTE